MDACSVEDQSLIVIDMDTEQICKAFMFESNTNWKIFNKKKNILDKVDGSIENDMEEAFYNILENKIYLYKNVFKNNKVSNSIKFPVHIERITTNVCKMENSKSDITPTVEILNGNYKLKQSIDTKKK